MHIIGEEFPELLELNKMNNVIGTFASIFLVVPKERSTSSIAVMDFVATLYVIIHGR